MPLDRLRYCIKVRRIVATDEFHAGAFTSNACGGCEPIPTWMYGIVQVELHEIITRSERQLQLLEETGERDG